jgi:hypothetical protein
MVRSICAVVASVIIWFLVASIGNLALRIALPGYSAAEGDMSFTLSMQIGRLLLGLVSSVCAGFACALIAREKGAPVRIVAILIVLLFLPVHYALWEKFPAWYHAFFLITLAPAVLLGAALRQRLHVRQLA